MSEPAARERFGNAQLAFSDLEKIDGVSRKIDVPLRVNIRSEIFNERFRRRVEFFGGNILAVDDEQRVALNRLDRGFYPVVFFLKPRHGKTERVLVRSE